MARNVEIKARLADLGSVEARARALSSGEPERLVQRDVFFNVPSGRLKLRSFAEGTPELIFYQRPDTEGPKTSNYQRLPVGNADATEELLSAALGTRGVIEKTRLVYLVGATRIHLDDVVGLGTFLELEVVLRDDQSDDDGGRVAKDLLAQLGVAPKQLVRGAYLDLLRAGRAGCGHLDTSSERA